jgi:hypothetical protein
MWTHRRPEKKGTMARQAFRIRPPAHRGLRPGGKAEVGSWTRRRPKKWDYGAATCHFLIIFSR